MNGRQSMVALAVLAIAAAAGYGLYRVGMDAGMKMAAPATAASPERKILYWHDPMTPGTKFDKPGKSPFMDMQLVPVYADEAQGEGGVSIDPRVQQNLGMRTAKSIRGDIAQAVVAVGSVVYDERNVAVLQARASAFVERLHVRAPLDAVRKGQPLVDLYVPEWVAAQEEYLGLKRMPGTGFEDLREGAVQRMRLAGMGEDLIQRVQSTGAVQSRFTLSSPINGVVVELAVREGMTVANGATLFRITGLDPIWINAEIPESQAARVRPGNAAEGRTTALPDRVFKGKVSAILPDVNAATRTLKARIELANPSGELVPGMFATVTFSPGAKREAVLVPSEAVIRTGKRTVVVVAAEAGAKGSGQFMPVDVEIGAEGNGMTEIVKGIEAGTVVVVSGQFLIDSEASLKGTLSRMSPAAP